MVLPALSLISLLFFYPLFFNIWQSFHRVVLAFPQPVFIGFGNYERLFSDPIFWKAFKNSAFYTSVSIGLQILIALPLALALNQPLKGRSVFRTIMIVPWGMPIIATAFIWQWIYYSDGVLNYFLERLNLISSRTPWLSNPETAMWAAIIATLWRLTPFVIVVLLAGLQQIPPILYESATIDGGGAWAKFRYITLPMLKHVIIIVILLRTIWTFTWFDFIYLLTGGGPADATMILPILVYQGAFLGHTPGLASAIATLMMIPLLIIASIYLKWRGKIL